MDVARYIEVLWRFRLILVAGVSLAILLAVLAYAKITIGVGGLDVAPRGSETWQSKSVMLITQTGFPWGRAVPKYTEPDPRGGAPAVPLGDQSRFSALSSIYSQLANSDSVRAELLRSVRVRGSVQAEASADPSGAPLPLMTVTATSDTARNAALLSRGSTEAFRAYVAEQQRRARIPAGERTELQVLESGQKPELLAPRKKTLPGLVFFAVMAATLGLVFVLENLSSTMRPTPHGEWPAAVPPPKARARDVGAAERV